GPRARAGAGDDAVRDGPRGAQSPARLGAPRADVADAQHGSRRLPARPREHARPPEPLVEGRIPLPAHAVRDRPGGAHAVPVADGACPRRLSLNTGPAMAAAPRSSRLGSGSPASSPTRTSRSPATR